MPQLAPSSHMLSAVPDGKDVVLEYVGSPDDVNSLRFLVGEAAISSRSSSLLAEALAADLDSRCQPIHHDECPTIKEDDASSQRKKAIMRYARSMHSQRGWVHTP